MKLRKKSDSKLMRLADLFLRWTTNGRFMADMWTTVGDTVYTPTRYDADPDWGTEGWQAVHRSALAHEQVHIDQLNRWGPLVHELLYIGPSPFLLGAGLLLAWPSGAAGAICLVLGLLLSPLSLGLAWGRWRVEREAYLVQVRAAAPPDRASVIQAVVHTLWYNYLFPWPPSWMEAWFEEASR